MPLANYNIKKYTTISRGDTKKKFKDIYYYVDLNYFSIVNHDSYQENYSNVSIKRRKVSGD